MIDESHLPYGEQSLLYKLRRRAQIRRGITTRKSVQNGEPDKMSDLLEEAANELERLKGLHCETCIDQSCGGPK